MRLKIRFYARKNQRNMKKCAFRIINIWCNEAVHSLQGDVIQNRGLLQYSINNLGRIILLKLLRFDLRMTSSLREDLQ